MKREVDINLLVSTLKQYEEIQRDVDDALRFVEWMLPEKLMHSYNDLVFDLLGVPADSYDHVTATGFCRDWLHDQWCQFVSEDISFDALMKEIDETVSEFSA
jgi:hypothetical protein